MKGHTIMKGHRSAAARIARKLSCGVLANRYLDLQKLRDEVRKAETNCTPRTLKKPRDRKQLDS